MECGKVVLTPSTAELISRYAKLSDDGRIEQFQIINEEIISALRSAAEVARSRMAANEQLSGHWDVPSPCEQCAERGRCTITCRLKHAYEKEVFGGLLCGRLAALTQSTLKGENNVYFNVYFVGQTTLEFYRSVGFGSGLISLGRRGGVSINGRTIVLRPWSEALYRLFVSHPEGVVLGQIATTHKAEFLAHYERASRSQLKLSKTKALLNDAEGFTRLINNKLAELNSQLRSAGVEEMYHVLPAQRKSNFKPYFIAYLRPAADQPTEAE